VVVEADVEAGAEVEGPVEAFADGEALVVADEAEGAAGAGSFLSATDSPSEGAEGGFSLSE